jgi:putative Holliday junction resolvase
LSASFVIGFDYGLKNIGVSIGQVVTRTASPKPSISAKDGVPNWGDIGALIKEWDINTAVVGLPLNMDGTESALSIRSRKFANRLHGRFGLKVHLMDERLSSREAKMEASAFGHKGNYSKNPVDGIAARIILESWLNQLP